ncbi:ferric reductase-like transmembrane domain-containing protein [Methylocella sp.]|uniref:ferredoxin reductase family protein n=1 Tax=Methylocella sp. TaxID=1978226 RepID=UPI0035AF5601
MRNAKLTLWGFLALLTLAWLLAEAAALPPQTLFAWRAAMLQLTGLLAIGCMAAATMLALRPRWPEKWFGGLDKMYRLHKWLGVATLAVGVVHWLWAKAPPWAVELGWIERGARGGRPPPGGPVEAFLAGLRGPAASAGEWAFYGLAALIALALSPAFPYRPFARTHRLIALAFLALAFHALALTRFRYWSQPIGWLTAPLLAGGAAAVAIALLGLVGARRRVKGEIVALQYYPGVRALETTIALEKGWPGHAAGQFAFKIADAAEGGHPYTIASAWRPDERTVTFVIKELGDYTRRLHEKLRVGMPTIVEGPYGCFTFDDDRPRQIWIGAGAGVTPFLARLKHMALQRDAPDWPSCQRAYLYHTTAEIDEAALESLAADAAEADVRLHILVDARDGRLTGERIREHVPDWAEASIWFCGPAAFGAALRRDFAAKGFPVQRRFHQELFAMR